MAPNKNISPCKRGNWFGKPYYFFGDYLQHKYRCRILKIPIDAGFTCPNRDGTVGSGGCIFCGEDGSASPTAHISSDIKEQMRNARISFKRSDAETKYIAYFQAFSNTYAPPEVLKLLYDSALEEIDIMGLMIGTRPDCLPDEVLDLIAQYNQKELWLEIGMQTSHDKSLKQLNRGHTHHDTVSAIERASQRGIPLCLHIILGIPGESWNDMIDTADEISRLPVQGVKFHHLHVIEGTALATMYNQGDVPVMSLHEYVSTLCDCLEHLRPDIIIHRLLGDRNEASLIAPAWGMHKGTVLKAIEDEFSKRGTYQSFLYKG